MTKWLPSGIDDLNLVSNSERGPALSDGVVSQILTTLKTKGNAKLPDDEVSIQLQEIASVYTWGGDVKEATKPARVRQNLKAALDEIDPAIQSGNFIKFINRVNQLDMVSRHLLHIPQFNNLIRSIIKQGNRPPESRNEKVLHACLNKCRQMLVQAIEVSEGYPQRGRLPDAHRLNFAVDVRELLKKIGLTPTMVKGGIFDQVLILMLTELDRQEYTDLHTLAESALRAEHGTHWLHRPTTG